MEEKVAQEPQRAKPSPDYPSRSLKGCFDDARRIFQKFTGGSFSDVDVASRLEVKVSTGAFRSRIASLKYFGLLEGSGGTFRVSALFQRMYRAEPGDVAFNLAAYEAIRHVPIFNRVLSDLKNQLPSHDVLLKRLPLDFGFSSAGAERAATVLRESLAYAGVIDASGNVVPPKNGGSSDVEGEHGANSTAGGGSDGGERRTESPGAAPPPPAGSVPSPTTPGQLQLQVPILGSPGRSITLLYPHDLQPHEAGYVQLILNAMLGALASGGQPS